MQNTRDLSIWRSLAVAFGDGLAFGVGVKLSQNAARQNGAPAVRNPPAGDRLEQLEERLRQIERTPLTGAGPFDQKVLEAVVNALEARLNEHTAQMERRLAELESRIAVDMRELQRQTESLEGRVDQGTGVLREEIAAEILSVGKEFGIVPVGSRAYATNTLESGWVPSPLPAVYTDERMKKYREWLPANSYEAAGAIGGSFVSKNIEDYYLSPWDMGYGTFIDFDHEFIGREALQKRATAPHRQKVTLVLDEADVLHAIGSQLEPGERAKFIEFPSAVYSMHPYDKVMVGGTTVGISTWIGYSASERKMLTIAVIDAQHAKPGTTVTYVWGEEGGGTSKPAVERHRQMEIGATVAPVPYVEAVRKSYTDRGWRTAQV